MQGRVEDGVREKLQDLEELAIAYDQKCDKARCLEDELREQVTQLGEMKERLLQLAAWISGPDLSPDEQDTMEGGAPGGERSEELTGWMLEVKDDKIRKQCRQIKELKRRVEL